MSITPSGGHCTYIARSSWERNVERGGTLTWIGRYGILAATDVQKVQVRGMKLRLKSENLSWPAGVDYTTYNGFRIDYGGRWI